MYSSSDLKRALTMLERLAAHNDSDDLDQAAWHLNKFIEENLKE